VLTKVRQITKITTMHMDGVKVTKLSAENEIIYKTIYEELMEIDNINSQREDPVL
jgi:hypothetical protein